VPVYNPRGRLLAPAPPELSKETLIQVATQAMENANLPRWDIHTMQTRASRARSVMGALRSISKWVDLGKPESTTH